MQASRSPLVRSGWITQLLERVTPPLMPAPSRVVAGILYRRPSCRLTGRAGEQRYSRAYKEAGIAKGEYTRVLDRMEGGTSSP